MAKNESARSFGHWGSRGAKQQPAPPRGEAPKRRNATPAEDDAPDATREGLETLADRRRRRAQLVDPVRPAPDPRAEEQTRSTLRQLAELRRAQPELPDLTNGMWERVVTLAKPLVTPPGAPAPPRSPAPPTNGARRRTPGR